MLNDSTAIVSKVWNYAHVLKNAGVGYVDYIEARAARALITHLLLAPNFRLRAVAQPCGLPVCFRPSPLCFGSPSARLLRLGKARGTAIVHLEAGLDRQLARSMRLRQSILSNAFSDQLVETHSTPVRAEEEMRNKGFSPKGFGQPSTTPS
jgi:hypothetical protein